MVKVRRLLSKGSTGDDVKKVQTRLNEIYEEQLTVDGLFGRRTKETVMAFQDEEGLVADGIVGPLTWEKLFGEIPEEMPPLPGPSEPPATDPVWVKWMKSKMGIHEVPGGGDNPEIVSWLKMTGVPPSMYHDATPWCAACVNAALKLNKVKGTVGSAAAVDWLLFGEEVDEPCLGALAIFEWRNGGHHVAFVLRDLGDTIECIGGNQSDAITIDEFPKSAVIGYRMPA